MTDSGSQLLHTVEHINALVTGRPTTVSGGGRAAASGPDSGPATGPTPSAQASGLALQSVAQSAAMIVQDASNLFRNLSTIEATAIGAATAKWIETPENVAYLLIIEESQRVIQNAATIIEAAGKSASQVLQAFSGAPGT